MIVEEQAGLITRHRVRESLIGARMGVDPDLTAEEAEKWADEIEREGLLYRVHDRVAESLGNLTVLSRHPA